jgi:hypothetical protein
MLAGTGNPSIQPFIEKGIEKLIQIVQNDTIKKKIQILLLDPFMSYIIERLFPYLIVVGVIFIILIVLCICIVWMLLVGRPPIASLHIE